MGYCYQFKSKPIRLKKDVPQEIIDFLDGRINQKKYTIKEPNHPLFSMRRWETLFNDCGYGEPYFKIEKEYYVLSIFPNINYGFAEIETFAEWISPYVAGHKPREFIGRMKGDEGNWENIYIHRPGQPSRLKRFMISVFQKK